MSQPVRVLIADDQQIVRECLATLLGLLDDIDVVGAARNGHEAVALAASLHPDIVLMDLQMPHCDGIEAIRLLREQAPAIRVLVLTTFADDRSVIDALRVGASGYLTKDVGGAEIRRAVHQIMDDRDDRSGGAAPTLR